MKRITIRELRNQGGRVVERVEGGETFIVTRAGRPVGELRPLRRSPLKASVLLQAWRKLPHVDPNALQADLDAALDPCL